MNRDLKKVLLITFAIIYFLLSTVPLSFSGRSRGEEKGGIVEHLLRELVIECFPEKIPSTIEVDITSLDIGDSLQVKDLKVSSDITIKNPPKFILFSYICPMVPKLSWIL